ncbi:hypothetical protein NDU88_005767 [Pleurodeles waltl]|uniref:WH1 domain-containing protein n=1 Tax=Pleurodeles waltl TaxID=8319 RepID=A0AAV7L5K1_PLEWA|nr:hypothetical protein NDU88_005767 [Pleurodeles waltl]
MCRASWGREHRGKKTQNKERREETSKELHFWEQPSEGRGPRQRLQEREGAGVPAPGGGGTGPPGSRGRAPRSALAPGAGSGPARALRGSAVPGFARAQAGPGGTRGSRTSSPTADPGRPGPGATEPGGRAPGEMGEQPIFSARAHVFQIDPSTKRNWIPASKHAVTVSYFYDATRNVYRVISVGGTKAIINSTITPNMTFTKTSQKFGQWADSRANTVYGLGFASEQHLSQFAEKFQEVKEAARLAREKSQDRTELTHPALHLGSQQTLPCPLIGINGPSDDKLFRSQSADTEITTEKERLKKMLSEGSVCEVQWEAEFFSLQDSNNKLVAALQEANSNVEQWKKQLAAYQEETERLRQRVSELEAQGSQEGASNGAEETGRNVEELEALLKAKEQEIHSLRSQKPDAEDLESERDGTREKLQEAEARNEELEQQLRHAEQMLEEVLSEREKMQSEVNKVGELLDIKLFELSELRQSLAKLIENN